MNIVKVISTTALVFGQLVAQQAYAQAFPSRPIKIIVPVATGGTSDVLARQLAVRLQQLWGQGVVIENKPGATGNIATEMVVRSPADGYTLVLQSNAMVINQALGVKANYDPNKDLTPVALLGQTPMVIVTSPKTPASSLGELVALAKANPGSLSYASCGIAGPHHMFMELVKQKSGIEMTHVAYKGCAPGLTDVLGDQIPVAVLSANAVISYVKSGKIKTIGLSSAKRYTPLPNTKTLEEQGLKPMDLTNWYALFGPANMPQELTARLYGDITKALNDELLRTSLTSAGVEVATGTGEYIRRLMSADRIKYEQIAKTANIKLE